MSKAGLRRPTRRGLAKPQDGGTSQAFDKHKLWHYAQWITLAALIIYAAYQSHYIVFRASYFKLQKLTIVGNQVIPREQLVSMSGLALGMPVFELDKAVVAKRLQVLPRVEQVSLEQRGPNEVVITIKEKEPAARIHVGGDPLEVGHDGAILGKAGARSEGLPWILGVEVLPSAGGLGMQLDTRAVTGLVEWLPVLADSPLAGFSSISFPAPGKVVVMWNDIEFFLAEKELFERHCRQIGDLQTLQSEAKRRLQYVDLRFHDIVARFHPVD